MTDSIPETIEVGDDPTEGLPGKLMAIYHECANGRPINGGDLERIEEAVSALQSSEAARLKAEDERDEALAVCSVHFNLEQHWNREFHREKARAEAAEAERDRLKPTPSPHEHMHSVVYRQGPLTPEDYDEAIADLQNARKALIEGDSMGCRVCEDSGHGANICHHNPLLLARKWASASRFWQCYHCGFVATNDAEASEHFGRHDGEEPSCVRAELEARAQAAELRASKAEGERDAARAKLERLQHLLRITDRCPECTGSHGRGPCLPPSPPRPPHNMMG